MQYLPAKNKRRFMPTPSFPTLKRLRIIFAQFSRWSSYISARHNLVQHSKRQVVVLLHNGAHP